jgi:hypothetical protein
MPTFHYDIVMGSSYRDQGCIELADRGAAIERADRLARDLLTLRPDLMGHGAAVRVADEDNVQVYRTSLEPMPTWQLSHRGE